MTRFLLTLILLALLATGCAVYVPDYDYPHHYYGYYYYESPYGYPYSYHPYHWKGHEHWEHEK